MIIAQTLGIYIFYQPLGKIIGMYKYMQKSRVIIINSDIQDDVMRRVVLSHELGHAILHPKENCCFMGHHTLLLTSKIERQANLFAAHLLITDDIINDFEGFTKEQFCNSTGYPAELLDLKIKK